ncbi:MAG TPA: IS4 family transposase, partial [Caldilineae bacterium]|nr:IS4 family transposase [Caldilineae bacterium]
TVQTKQDTPPFLKLPEHNFRLYLITLSQWLSADHSCRDAVAGLIAWRVAEGLRPCSADTGAYCTARGNLPEEAVHELVRDSGRQQEDQAEESWLWHGRRVRVVDGSTITMPDTPENQAAYPQQENQKPGCGFPIARIVVIFSLAVGTVLEAAIGKYQGKQTGENSLLRTLYDVLAEGDILLADRYFSGWCDIALPLARGVHVVVRKHQLRHTDFRTGRRLGKDDHLVSWPKPQRPKWMSAEQYAELPEALTLRELRVRVAQKGFRTKTLVVVTPLLDAEQYPPEEIALLYRQRWQAELHLRVLSVSVHEVDFRICYRGRPHVPGGGRWRIRNDVNYRENWRGRGIDFRRGGGLAKRGRGFENRCGR